MTFLRLIRRSLTFHWRSHLGVVLGAAIGSAALIGALVVGDSVRESLKDRAEARLGGVELALASGDRLFGEDLVTRLKEARPTSPTAKVTGPGGASQFSWGEAGTSRAAGLILQGLAARQDGAARAHDVQILGVPPQFWFLSPSETRRGEEGRLGVAGAAALGMTGTAPAPGVISAFTNLAAKAASEGWLGELNLRLASLAADGSITNALRDWSGPAPGQVRINQALAAQLSAKAGDTVVLRFPKPSALSQDAVLSPRDSSSVAMRLVVDAVVDAGGFGEFSLKSGQRPALNAFVNPDELQRLAGIDHRANLLLIGAGRNRSQIAEWRKKALQGLASSRGWMPRSVYEMLYRTLRSVRHAGLTEMAMSAKTLDHVRQELAHTWRLSDAEIEVRIVGANPESGGGDADPTMVEVATRRIFLDSVVGNVALNTPSPSLAEFLPFRANGDPDIEGTSAFVTNGIPILTYLANSIRAGDRLTPYSIVTAAGAPWTPAGMRDDEIVVNEWLANDLKVKVGDRVEMAYYDPEAGARLLEKTNVFTVRQVVPLKGIHADRTLMPEFPGLSKAESTRDWDAGFPLVHPIRDEDEAYWKAHRGTPKAFVSEAAGRAMWANRFGELTAIRYRVPEGGFASGFQRIVEANLMANLKPSDLGLVFRPVRQEAMRAATSGQDFGGLFIGFSFFLVLAALLLMALMFQFGLEQRLPEVGTFLALGFRPRTVRRIWMAEGLMLAVVGGGIGVVAGLGYANAMIVGLGTIWREAVAGTPLAFHLTPGSLGAGLVASVVVCGATLWITMRRQFSRPARALLAGEIGEVRVGGRGRGFLVGGLALAGALALVGGAVASGKSTDAGVFFGAGSLVLIAGLGFVAGALRRMQGEGRHAGQAALTTGRLAVRGTARRRSRSLATVGLLASGTFLVAALGAFRMDAGRDAMRRTSGTGGFGLLAESSLPVSVDLNTEEGLEHFGLGSAELAGVSFVPFRVREGDDASCLNLDRAQRPRLLGVRPELLAERGAFQFGGMAADVDAKAGWRALSPGRTDGVPEIPAIGDVASIQWALGKKLGDTLEMTDERGRPFRLRLVGGVVNSILQGSLVIDEAALTRLFPGVTGYRWFLVDVASGEARAVSEKLSRALSDVGLEVAPATRRLAELNAVQNTYLSTFQILGGLGLLLGSAGLGVVVLRNVLERRGELALLSAVGFPQGTVVRLVLVEHAALLALGLGIGLGSAALAVLPSLLVPGAAFPLRSLGLTLGGVVLLGWTTAWVATRFSVRGSLLAALRGE